MLLAVIAPRCGDEENLYATSPKVVPSTEELGSGPLFRASKRHRHGTLTPERSGLGQDFPVLAPKAQAQRLSLGDSIYGTYYTSTYIAPACGCRAQYNRCTVRSRTGGCKNGQWSLTHRSCTSTTGHGCSCRGARSKFACSSRADKSLSVARCCLSSRC